MDSPTYLTFLGYYAKIFCIEIVSIKGSNHSFFEKGEAMKVISDHEKGRIRMAFKTLAKGDVLTTDEEDLVVIRHIGPRAVLGVICQCGKRHVASVIDDTFLWSDESSAIVGSDGSIPSWWSVDLQLERIAGMDIAEKAMEIPVSADYPKYSHKDFLDAHVSEMRRGIEMMLASSAPEASLRRLIEMTGVSMNDEQARTIFLVLMESSKISSKIDFGRELVESIFEHLHPSMDTEEMTKH